MAVLNDTGSSRFGSIRRGTGHERSQTYGISNKMTMREPTDDGAALDARTGEAPDHRPMTGSRKKLTDASLFFICYQLPWGRIIASNLSLSPLSMSFPVE